MGPMLTRLCLATKGKVIALEKCESLWCHLTLPQKTVFQWKIAKIHTLLDFAWSWLDFGSTLHKSLFATLDTAQIMKFFTKDFFSKCYQICSFLWIWSHLLKESLMENFIFCVVWCSNIKFDMEVSEMGFRICESFLDLNQLSQKLKKVTNTTYVTFWSSWAPVNSDHKQN